MSVRCGFDLWPHSVGYGSVRATSLQLHKLCIGHRCSLNLALLCLWCRPAAVALIQPLALEFPYAAGVPIKVKKKECVNFNKLLNLPVFPSVIDF